MRLFQLVILTTCVSLTSGCTVLGFAGDLTLGSVLEPTGNTSMEPGIKSKSFPLILTKEGLKQDVEMVKTLLANNKKSAELESTATRTQLERQEVLACKHVVEGKQQCYPAEYYKDMYITPNESANN